MAGFQAIALKQFLIMGEVFFFNQILGGSHLI